jgi:Mrp family chromosome partitioning ATPase
MEALNAVVMPASDHGQDVRPDGVSTLRYYARVLWRRKWIALAPLVAIPLVTLVATLGQPDVFEASADVLVNRQEVATTSLIGQTPALDDANRTMETQARLARVPTVFERTLAGAGLGGSSIYALRDSSSVFPLADILRFTVSDEQPSRAALLASEYAQQFVRYRRELDTAGLARTLAELRTDIGELEASGKVSSPLYVRLADREKQLESLVALRSSNVSVVRTADADDAVQVAPRPRRNAALALAAGLVVGLILVFLAESLTTKPRSDEEFEALLGMPLLARLPPGARSEAQLELAEPTSPSADAAHMLRMNLQFANGAVGARTIMITSPRERDGKSMAAAQLAFALARVGRNVALVDLDLRHPSLTRLLGLENGRGVTTISRGDDELGDVLVQLPVENATERATPARSNGRGFGTMLEVLAPGPLTAHPAEILTSDALAGILADLERRVDVVLVDVAPVLEGPDAAAIASRVDGLLLVVSSREARGPLLANAREAIERWPVARLGFVLAGSGADGPLHLGSFVRAARTGRTSGAGRERIT